MNLYTNFFTSFRTPMDIAMSYHLYQKLLHIEEKKKTDVSDVSDGSKENQKQIYQSPKRDMICCQCGQQVHWCVCKDECKNI